MIVVLKGCLKFISTKEHNYGISIVYMIQQEFTYSLQNLIPHKAIDLRNYWNAFEKCKLLIQFVVPLSSFIY